MKMENKLIEVQSRLLKVLEKLDEVCVENDIEYSISDGTAIGAVREKGFIAWDDDVDVIMDYSNFQKLLKLNPDGFKIEKYKSWVPRFYMDGEELFIDILLLYGISSNKTKASIKIFLIKIMQGTLKSKPTKGKGRLNYFLSVATYYLGKPFSKRFKVDLYDRISLKLFTGDKFLFPAYYSFNHLKDIFPKRIIQNYIRIPFEDIEVMLMEGYDEYLSIVYGDYMTPPPREEQVPKHGNIDKI